MTTAAHHLARIGILWPHLDDALDQHGAAAWPPAGRMRDYLAALDEADRVSLRALERDPQQIGETRAPLSIRILDTARLVETTLVHLADTLAPAITRPAISHAPIEWEARGWTPTDRAIRNQCADDEQADPRRWRYVGLRTAEYAAGWLHARVTDQPGPFRPLDGYQYLHVEQVAAGCAERIAAALDLTTREVPDTRPCPRCSGQLVVTTGAGRPPSARCADCASGWTLAEPVAA